MTGVSDGAVESVFVVVVANVGRAAAVVGAYDVGTVVADENLHSNPHKKTGSACIADFSPHPLSWICRFFAE